MMEMALLIDCRVYYNLEQRLGFLSDLSEKMGHVQLFVVHYLDISAVPMGLVWLIIIIFTQNKNNFIKQNIIQYNQIEKQITSQKQLASLFPDRLTYNNLKNQRYSKQSKLHQHR